MVGTVLHVGEQTPCVFQAMDTIVSTNAPYAIDHVIQ